VTLLRQDRSPQLPRQEANFRRWQPLIAVAEINLLARIMLFLMYCGIFGIFSTSAISGSLFITWAYQHYILTLEVKNSVKVTLLSCYTTAIFLHDLTVSDNDVLEVG